MKNLRIGRSPGFPCAAPSRSFLISGKGEAAVSAIAEKDYSCGNSFRFCWRFRFTEFPFNSETNMFPKPTPLTFKLQTDQITNNPLE